MGKIYGNQTQPDVQSDDDDVHNHTYVTVHSESFTERDFNNFLNCLDTLRESKKRRSRDKVIRNYCVQVPYIDNSMCCDDDNSQRSMLGNSFEKKCDEMKNNISQMFTYFDEDVELNYDDFETAEAERLSDAQNKIKNKQMSSELNAKNSKTPEDFREKFLRNRRRIKEMSDRSMNGNDTKPIIRGVVKKPHITNQLKKNQIDQIMNEFNRVKINYYSKDNFVEFTNIDYAYCDSDVESIRSECIGKLNKQILSKFEIPEIDDAKRKSLLDTEIVPKNSVRDKISMFSKMDMLIKPIDNGILMKCSSAPDELLSEKKFQHELPPPIESEMMQRKFLDSKIKNMKSNIKNQNKCFIKDINNSIRSEELDQTTVNEKFHEKVAMDALERIVSFVKLNDIDLLMALEYIMNGFNMSLLHTISNLMHDEAFTLNGRKINSLNVQTCPSIEHFNKAFNSAQHTYDMDRIELQSIPGAHEIQMQLHVNATNATTNEMDKMEINVIFIAQYETADGNDTKLQPPTTDSGNVAAKSFFIYFTSLFEVFYIFRGKGIF